MKILIKNGHVLDPATGKDGKFDVLLENSKILKVEPMILESADQIIEAEGHFVMPGFVDLHVHFREPGFEHKETIRSGSMAAARGGFTSVCPMPNTMPAIDTIEQIEYIKKKEAEDSLVHLIPVGAVTMGQKGEALTDIKAMAAAGMKAISEDGKSVMNAQLYREAMMKAKEAGIVILAHCEDKNLAGKGAMNAGKQADAFGIPGITNAVEDVIVARDILLAKETGAKLHLCHCSTKDSVSLLKWAKDEGQDVSGEVCPHHFCLTEDDMKSADTNFKMNPPLRTKEDVDMLIQGLSDNIMDAIATDHAPHTAEEKNRPFTEAPFGIVGLETAFALTYTNLVKTGLLSPMQMVEKLSLNPAKIIGIDKGSLEPGCTADIVIADPMAEYSIHSEDFHSKGKNTPFENKTVFGKILYTIVDGKIVYQESVK